LSNSHFSFHTVSALGISVTKHLPNPPYGTLVLQCNNYLDRNAVRMHHYTGGMEEHPTFRIL
jgi:hypothetical protein